MTGYRYPLFGSHVSDRLLHPNTERWVSGGPRHVTLTQALAHGHAVLLRVEIVAVAGTAPVDEAQAFLLVHVEVPAGHGGATGARLGLQGAHLCEGTARSVVRPLSLMLIPKATT